MYGYRTGAKQEQINIIRQLNSEGVAPEEISQRILVDVNCVKSFCNVFNRQKEKDVTPKKAAREEAAKAETLSENAADTEPEQVKRKPGRPPKANS